MPGFLQRYVKEGKIFTSMDEFDLTKGQQLFQKLAFHLAGSYSNISTYNNWVTNILPKQVEKRSFISPDGVKVILKDVFLHPPKKVINGKEELIYPQYCRSRKYPYTGRLEATVVTIKPGGTKTTMENLTLGYIPIMLNSVKCNLHGKSKEELVRLGECISDPFGYFIISSERTIINIDKTSIHISVIKVDRKTGRYCVIHAYTTNRRITLKTSNKWNSIMIDDPVDENMWREEGKEKRNFPIFLVYKILEDLEPDQTIEEYILPLFDNSLHSRVKNALTESVIDYKSIKDPYRYLYILRSGNRAPVEEIKEEIKESLEKYLFVIIYDYLERREERIKAKLTSLSFILARYVSYFIGNTQPDDLNSWSSKRFESPGVSMEILFETIFARVMKTCRKTQGVAGVIDYSSFGLKLRDKSEGIIRSDFENSFNTSVWGVHGTKFVRANYSEATLRDTPLQLWSQIDKDNANVSSSMSGGKRDVRQVQPTQRCHHCIIETPESNAIGYVKHNAITNTFSISRDKGEISKIVTKECGPRSSENYILVCLNGVAMLKDGNIAYGSKDIEGKLISLRRSGKLPFDVEIYKFREFNAIDVQCNSSRPVAPYLVINKRSKELVIDEMNGWKWSLDKLIKSGCIEFLGPREEEKESTTISCSLENFYEKKKLIENSELAVSQYYENIYNYSHCNIDPNQMLSVSANICPYANQQMPARSIFQAGMAKQALAFFNINYHLRYNTTFKRLYKATRSLCETMIYPVPALDLFPSGQTAIVAFYPTSDNQEDAIVISEDYLDAINLTYITYKTIKYSQSTQIAGAIEKFQRPSVSGDEDPAIYNNIDDNGFPILDRYIRKGDCILGKVLVKKDGQYNNSIYAQMDEEGYVEAIEVNRERDGQQILVKIRLRRRRKYQAGDKLALRYAQKGTVGRVAKREELLRVRSGPNKGLYPHVVFCPLGFPTRQTTGMLEEGIYGKAALYTGKRVNASSFQDHSQALKDAKRVLTQNGLDPGGYEDMETYDGRPIRKKIVVVPMYYQALRHHVMDKIQMRDTGNKNIYTHQPIGGRTTGSGIRGGEMEKDSFIAHGASAVQVERLMKSSDEFRMQICGRCGFIMNTKICKKCGDSGKRGVVRIPYPFKLLIQLLNGVGIQIKINTERFE